MSGRVEMGLIVHRDAVTVSIQEKKQQSRYHKRWIVIQVYSTYLQTCEVWHEDEHGQSRIQVCNPPLPFNSPYLFLCLFHIPFN